MLPAFVDVETLAARIPGGIDVDDEARAQAALDDASTLVRAAAGIDWVDEHGQLVADVPDVVATVTAAAARRAFVNPEGLAQETVAGYGASYSSASGDVYLTKTERKLIRRAAGIASSGSITLASPYEMPATTVWHPGVNGYVVRPSPGSLSPVDGGESAPYLEPGV